MGTKFFARALPLPRRSDQSEPLALAMSRRAFLAGVPLALAACTTTGGGFGPPHFAWQDETPQQLYGPLKDTIVVDKEEKDVTIPAVDLKRIAPQFYRAVVDYPTKEPAGTIVVDPGARYLYLVLGGNQAIRYGVGVGREGFLWHGTAVIRMKRKWPTWTPPSEMIDREPQLAKYRDGKPGGLDNPLGARALYLFEGDQDTYYRIHGTNMPWTVGHAVSSGCIRMINQDAVDLFSRVKIGTKVVVLDTAHASEKAAAKAATSKKAKAAKPAKPAKATSASLADPADETNG
ncbi:L,D-transpeptidase [Segnochrobactrum spirostomi]|nr:L,D-transpeptidase [Segnochrobactrum spirostomi]